MSWLKIRKSFDEEPLEPASYLFWYITVVFGISFTFLNHQMGADRTVLFKTSVVHLSGAFTNVWGLLCLMAATGVAVGLLARIPKLYSFSTVLAFCCWTYASVIYVTDQFWFGLLVAAVPNMLFWAAAYLRRNKVL